MENKLTHDTIVGSGLASNFINLMKLEGWLPIEDYFVMRNDGFIAIPEIAEYRFGQNPGWYNSAGQCIDDWTNAIMFKPIETKNVADRIRDELLNECEEKEGIENISDFEDAFTETLIKLCKGNSERYVKKLTK